MSPSRSVCLLVGLMAAVGVVAADAADLGPFEVQLLTVDANEGCDVADVDGDGKPDVIAGRNWFKNGDWAARPLRHIDDWNGYVESNGDFAYDVNGDGRMDVIAGSFIPSQVYWYENPGEQGLKLGQMWQQHLLADTGLSENEGSFLHDINGDGAPEWITDSWNRGNPLFAWDFGSVLEETQRQEGDVTSTEQGWQPTLLRHTIGTAGNGHGMGFGDLNNDGREDILVGTGWYERPEGDPFAQEWPFHADWSLDASCPMLVRDIDADGSSDIAWGKGHDYGLYVWWGRGPGADGKLVFEETLIDDTFSQPHALHFADLNGDGHDEIITGKRYRAHNDGDPGAADPLILVAFSFDAAEHKFERHVISDGEAGIGLQIRTADLDADGDLEIVVAGKDGTQIVWNRQVK
jgi:hypothetical protein